VIETGGKKPPVFVFFANMPLIRDELSVT